MANTEKIVVQVVVQGDKDLQRLEGRTKKTTASFGKMAAGIAGAVTAFRTVTSAVSSAIRSFRDFEFQMAKVKAITGANRTEFLKLTKSAQDLGRSTFFTAQQVAELQTNYGKLGFTTQEILDAQEATLQLATATDSDLGRAAIVAGSAVRGFGLDASETKRVVDVMAVAFTSSALDIEKFQTSMTKVAPIAKSAGFSIEDTTAIMSQLADSGIEASIAGTSLRNILLKMQDPNSDLVKSFGKTIHSLDELVPALTKFSKEGGSLAEIMEVVDLRQAAAFEQMITSRERTIQLRDALEGASGAAEEMARIVGDTLEGALKRSESATQGFAIAFMDLFGKTFQNIVDGFASFVNVLTDFIEIPISEKLEKDRHEMNLLFEVLKDTNNSQETRNKAMTRLNLEYGSYLPNLITEKDTVKQLSEHQFNSNKQLAKRIEMMGAQERLNEIQKEGQKIAAEIFDETVKLRDLQEDMGTSREKFVMGDMGVMISVTGASILTTESNLKKLNKELEVFKKEQEDAIKVAKEFGIDVDKNNKVVEDSTTTTNTNTNSIDANTDAKKNLISAEEELLNFRFNMMVQGDLNAEQSAKLRKDLIRQEIKNIKLLLEQETLLFQSREDLLLKLHQLEEQLAADDKKRKDKALEEDIVRAALSGQNALESVKSVIRARIMEAVATQIKEIIATVPFPANLIVAAGAGMMIAKLVDRGMSMIPSEFGNGGVVEYANGGMVHGRSHAQGGEKFAVGGRVVELEGGEAVINKRSTAMFRNQLSAMNAAGGGVKFADGGLLNMPSFTQQQFNALSQNQMMGAMGSASKVVVVEADITDSQNAVSVIQSSATV